MEWPGNLTSPVRTGNLVLKTRIALVIRNLQHVQRALGTVQQRRMYLRPVLTFPERAEDSVEQIGSAYNRAYDGYESGSWEEIKNGLDRLGDEIDKLNREASALRHPVSELRRAVMLDEDEVARADSVANAVHQALKNAVSKEFGEELAKLQS